MLLVVLETLQQLLQQVKVIVVVVYPIVQKVLEAVAVLLTPAVVQEQILPAMVVMVLQVQ
jgi:hypothetical protein